MARNWRSIRVDLIEGRGSDFWPRPGRVFAAAGAHTFADLATAIDTAFARWDHAHLHVFELGDGSRIGSVFEDEDDDDDDGLVESGTVKLGRLSTGESFVYTFDFGDDWTHLCTVGDEKIDPTEVLGIVPTKPLPYDGWGTMPDQYGRRWDSDDGEGKPPPNPGKRDLPPLSPGWGARGNA